MAIIRVSNIAIVGMQTLGYDHSNLTIYAIENIFISHFGVCVVVCDEIWSRLVCTGELLTCVRQKHLFWALLHMKTYCTQRVLCTIVKTCCTTFNKYVHHIIRVLAELDMIKLNNRYLNNKGCTCLMTVDGTDFSIQEPKPFWSGWYSHKFKGPGLRYEIGVCIQTGWIVWVHGPYPCGRFNDIRIFRLYLQGLLDDRERVLADGGYKDGGERTTETPTGLNNYDQYMKSTARARHETVNRRFKQFSILGARYRGDLKEHKNYMMAVANIVQIDIESGNEMFSLTYNDRTSMNYHQE